MKQTTIISSLLVSLVILTGCFSSRTDLFNLNIEEDYYTLYEEDIYIDRVGNVISYVSLSFKDLQSTVLENDDYPINTLGDFSFEAIKLFEIEFYLGLNEEEPIKHDLVFLGRANPGRGNAYRFSTTIEVVGQVDRKSVV